MNQQPRLPYFDLLDRCVRALEVNQDLVFETAIKAIDGNRSAAVLLQELERRRSVTADILKDLV